MRPIAALATVAVIALPWYVAVGIETQGAWLAGFLGKHNLERFMEPMEGHRGPIFYYLIAVVIGFFPWSIFLPLSLVELRQKLRRGSGSFSPCLLLACWAGFYIGFFSLAGTKLPSYVLPAYPALAIICGALVDAWLREPARFRGFMLRAALGSLPMVGIGILIALPIIAHFVLPGEGWLGLIGLILVIGGGYACWQSEAGRATRAAVAVAASTVVFATLVFGFAAPYVGHRQNSWPVVATAHQNALGKVRIATFDYFQPSLVYYAADRVDRVGTLADAAALLRDDPGAYIVTRDNYLDELQTLLPPDVTILSRQKRFLRSGEVVLIGRPAQTARTPAPAGAGAH
jgi:4-amino-4-deoxy-L-arabinose transferase-like glycosyltransferase